MASTQGRKGAKTQPEVKRDRNGLTRCRVCGCTEVDACNPPCGWVPGEADLCTGCDEVVRGIMFCMACARRVNKLAVWREVNRRLWA